MGTLRWFRPSLNSSPVSVRRFRLNNLQRTAILRVPLLIARVVDNYFTLHLELNPSTISPLEGFALSARFQVTGLYYMLRINVITLLEIASKRGSEQRGVLCTKALDTAGRSELPTPIRCHWTLHGDKRLRQKSNEVIFHGPSP